MTPICQHVKTKAHYEYLGENKFRNIETGKEGEVDETKAASVFNFNPELSQCVADYPDVLLLLKIGFIER